MVTERRGPPRQSSTPDQEGMSVTPQNMASHSHDFTLQAIMELHKSTGELTSTITSLKSSIDKQDQKLTALECTVSSVTHKIYAAGVVLTILVVIGGFMVNKTWDLMVDQITSKSSPTTTQEQQIKPKKNK